MTLVTSNLAERIEQLNQVFGIYASVSRRTPGDIVLRKGQQLLLGTGGRAGQRGSGGIFDGLAATAPAKGRVTTERRAAGFRVGVQNPATSRTLALAQERAGILLGGAKSGAFRVETGDAAGVTYLAGVSAGVVLQRGRKKGQLAFRSRSKTALPATGRRVSRAAAKAAGGAVLNRQALTVVLAIKLREHARFATAAQFLPRRYRTILRRRPELEYRQGQAVGISSTDAAQQHFHDRVTVQNFKGRELGSLEIAVDNGGASLRLRGELGIHTSQQEAVIAGALELVTADTTAYIVGKNNAALQSAARAVGFRFAA